MNPPQGQEPWMPNGFPPPSFVVEAERISSFAGSRGRWLAAAAILGVILLIAGIALIRRGGGKDNTLATNKTTTTAFGNTSSTLSTGSSVLDPTPSLPDAGTTPGTTGGAAAGPTTPTLPGSPTTGATTPGPTAAPGALSVTPGAVTLPKTAPQTGKVTLKNSGGSTLSFTAESNFPGALTANPNTGTLAAGASADISVALDGAKVGEGAFSGVLTFNSSSGGGQRVTVTSTVGRPPTIGETLGQPCAAETATCTKLIKVSSSNPADTPCTANWRFAAAVADESQLSYVVAKVTQGVVQTADLKINGQKIGPQGAWFSDENTKIAPGATLKFSIEASDQFSDVTRTTERTITCP